MRMVGKILVVVGVLLGAGVVSRMVVEEWVWGELREGQGVKLESVKGALGQGVSVGVLGGFRAVVADFLWLRANTLWEDRDLPGTQSLVRVVTTVDPRAVYFWVNGARMIGYDMPFWRILELGGYEKVSVEEQFAIDCEQADVALGYLGEGLRFHPESWSLLLEMGNLCLNRKKDVAAAAGFYLRASEKEGVPFFVARIYAELLKRQGKNREALEWLRGIYPGLPKRGSGAPEWMVEAASAEVVAERIRELEGELGE